MGVFALAFGGLALALDSSIGAGVEARNVARMRRELESRIAFCMAVPPDPGTRRVIEAKDNRGVRVEEMFEPYLVKTAEGIELQDLWNLTIKVEADGLQAEAETVVLRQGG